MAAFLPMKGHWCCQANLMATVACCMDHVESLIKQRSYFMCCCNPGLVRNKSLSVINFVNETAMISFKLIKKS